MFDRPMYPQLLTAAPVEGSVAMRPTSLGFEAEELRAGAAGKGAAHREKPRLGRRRAAARRGRRGLPERFRGSAGKRGRSRSRESRHGSDCRRGRGRRRRCRRHGRDREPGPPPTRPKASPRRRAQAQDQDLTGYGVYGATSAPVVAPTMSREELVTRYAHLVKYVVGRLGVSVPGLFDHEDAMQAGVLGLLRAIDAYRPESAASFESYAILRIRGSILDAVRSLDTVGRAGREAARAIQGAIRDLQHELGRSPTESEIAGRLGLPVARYRERLQAASVVTVSLDEHDARDERRRLGDPGRQRRRTRTPWTRPKKRPAATRSPRSSRRSAGSASARAWSSPCTTRTR